jgi:hypothetical protein
MLLPAGIAAATGYLVFAAVAGTTPLLPIAGQAPFDLRDLGGAAAIGVVAGIGARLAAATVRAAKRLRRRGHPATRAIVAGLVLAALFASGRLLGVANPTLGPGYDTMRWALQPDHAVLVVGTLAGLRLAATAATIAGGGTGGLFIPLVVKGALLGRMASGVVDPSNPTLFPVLGIAAFLGAGYRVPLASVVFVAEFTGRPGFIVPGLIAAMVAQLAMGSTSVSPYQAPGRPGHLERRLALPVEHVVDTSARTVPPDATVAELFWQHLVGGRQRAIPSWTASSTSAWPAPKTSPTSTAATGRRPALTPSPDGTYPPSASTNGSTTPSTPWTPPGSTASPSAMTGATSASSPSTMSSTSMT